jgi:hypothetical protein
LSGVSSRLVSEPSVLPPGPTPRVDPVPVIVANVTPVAGMLILRWSPPEILSLYALDTALALYAMCWLVMVHVTEADPSGRRRRNAVKFVAAALIGGTFFSVLLVGPVAITYADGEWLRSKPWLDRGFQGAMAMQALGSLYALVRTHRMLDQRDDDEKVLSTEFRFLVARWAIVIFVAFLGVVPALGDRLGSALLVVVYAGASVWFALFPEKAQQLFHKGKATSA